MSDRFECVRRASMSEQGERVSSAKSGSGDRGDGVYRVVG